MRAGGGGLGPLPDPGSQAERGAGRERMRPSCAGRTSQVGRAGGAGRGAAPGPRPARASRERGRRAHWADAPTAGGSAPCTAGAAVSWARGRGRGARAHFP